MWCHRKNRRTNIWHNHYFTGLEGEDQIPITQRQSAEGDVVTSPVPGDGGGGGDGSSGSDTWV